MEASRSCSVFALTAESHGGRRQRACISCGEIRSSYLTRISAISTEIFFGIPWPVQAYLVVFNTHDHEIFFHIFSIHYLEINLRLKLRAVSSGKCAYISKIRMTCRNEGILVLFCRLSGSCQFIGLYVFPIPQNGSTVHRRALST